MFGKKSEQSDGPKLQVPKKIPISESDHRMVALKREDGSMYEEDFYSLLELLDDLEELDMVEPMGDYMAAKAFLTGESGVPVNIQRGYFHLVRAARSEHTESQYLLGEAYLSPDSYFGRHLPTAIFWLQEAAKKNHTRAKQQLDNIRRRR